VAYYLAQLCAALVLTVSPHRIVMGGGIMQRVLTPTLNPYARQSGD
jgi:predicted NBD/HSP70 family sugar kinase